MVMHASEAPLVEHLSLGAIRVRETVSRPEHGGWYRPPELHLLQVVEGGFDFEHPEHGHKLLRAGEAIMISPGVRYYVCVKAPAAAKIRYAHLDIRFFDTLRISELAHLPAFLPARHGRPLGDAIAGLERARLARNLYELSSLSAERLATSELLHQVLRHAKLHEYGRKVLQGALRMLPIIGYMREHLEDPLTRGELAAVVGLSPSRFSAVFAEALGISPMRFLLHLKLQAARWELLKAGVTVTEVAARFGFADAFHFSKSFKKYFGVSPRGYLQQTLGTET